MKVCFIDSGIGGLLFGCDAILEMNKEYDLSHITFFHIGDSANMPYGNKTRSALLYCSKKLIEKAIDLGADKIVVACNTMSTLIDEEFKQQYNVEIITIIENTSEYIYKNTPLIENEKSILILGTKTTIESKKYELCIKKLNQAKEKLNIYAYYPNEWETEIENGINLKNIQNIVDDNLNKCHQIIGDRNFNRIQTIGLCCTHYSYFATQIQNYMKCNQMHTVKIISQGSIFAKHIAESEKKSTNKVLNNIAITSYITGENIDTISSIMENMYSDININFVRIHL